MQAGKTKALLVVLCLVIAGVLTIMLYLFLNGDPFLWPLIYWTNKVQIHDPDLIYPGQAFIIPRNFTSHEKEKAIYFSKYRGPWSLFDGK
jgi:hypothetical protein